MLLPNYDADGDRILADGDREVWVVERSRGDTWSTAAVLTSYDDAQRYTEDLREFTNTYPDGFPEEHETETSVRIRHGGRRSPTKLFESWPPEDRDAGSSGGDDGS